MQIAKRTERLGTETAFDVLAKVNALRARGKDVVAFSIGEPDFDTPANIKDAAKAALDRNETHYGPSNGILPLREAISLRSKQVRGVDCVPDEVVVCPGAKPIIFFTMLACLNEGDEAIYPNPGYPIYESMIRYVGAKAVPLPLLERKAFNFDVGDLRARVSAKTRLVILNSPQNPTGGVLKESDLDAVAELARRHGFWVLSDETYSQLVYEGTCRSIQSWPGMKERTIVADGASKTYAMTGWRLGWGIMPEPLARVQSRLMTNSNSCTTTFVQHAGIEALLGDQSGAHAMREEFRARRDLIVRLLNEIEGVTCLKPQGAFYVFPNVTEACRRLGFKTATEMQDFLLYEAGVAVLSRTCFGTINEGETDLYIRLSYATARDKIVEGLSRMKRALEGRAVAREAAGAQA